MAEIEISGYTVLIDDEDYEKVVALAWHVNKGNKKDVYFDHGEWDSILKRPQNISLHRFIMGCTKGDGVIIDHKDGNTLDCRKSNLRISNSSQNSKNQKARANRSGMKGITYEPRLKRWRARITVDYKCISLGTHETPEKAHAVYNEAAIKYFEEFARQ